MAVAAAVVVLLVLGGLLFGGGGRSEDPARPPLVAAPAGDELEGTVRAVAQEGRRALIEQPGTTERFQVLRVEIHTGNRRGQTVEAEFTQMEGSGAFSFRPGDGVVVQRAPGPDGERVERWVVIDAVRRPVLYWLAAAFAAAVVAVGGRRGAAALVGLVASFAGLGGVVLPRLLAGDNPVAVGVGGAIAIMVVTLYLTHGPSRMTTVAVAGTAASLLLTGLLSAAFLEAARLTGRTEDAQYLQLALPGVQLNVRGLLLGGVIIGALGVLDDATVAQSSVVFALRAANPALSWRELYRRGLAVGRDHIGSLVNTLALAYAGAGLPLLLLFSAVGMPGEVALNRELVATEVARTLLGSMGLIAAVPITTALAAWAASAGGRERGTDRDAALLRARNSEPALVSDAASVDPGPGRPGRP